MDKGKSLPRKNRIKQLRLEQHKTQKEVGKSVGLSDRAIAHYEKGIREPKLETWIKLADFFNVPVSYLQGLSTVNYRDDDELRKQFNESALAQRMGLHLEKGDKHFIHASDLDLIQRDTTLTTISKLKDVLFKELINISSEKQYQQLSDKFNAISEKQANKILFDMTMLFALLLQDGNDKAKGLLYQIAEAYYNKHFC